MDTKKDGLRLLGGTGHRPVAAGDSPAAVGAPR